MLVGYDVVKAWHGEMDIVRKIIGFLLSVPKNFDSLDDSGSLRDNRQWPA